LGTGEKVRTPIAGKEGEDYITVEEEGKRFRREEAGRKNAECYRCYMQLL